jgi:rhodanese-related sulfurtransferase
VPIREVTVEELSDAIKEARSPKLIDVRTEAEHAIAALLPCVHVPLHELATRIDEISPLKDSPVVVYCHHGVRSRAAAALLAAAGFHDVASLRGGIEAWSLRIDPRVPRY